MFKRLNFIHSKIISPNISILVIGYFFQGDSAPILWNIALKFNKH